MEERTLYQWVPRTEDALPQHTVPGGTDEYGSPLYIARFNIGNRQIFGKAGTQRTVGYYFEHGTQDSDTYEVLTLDPALPAKLVWKTYSPFSWDDMKLNAIGSSEQGYIARAPVLGGKWLTPGNMVEAGSLSLAYRKGITTSTGIEVLIVERERPLESHLFDIKYQAFYSNNRMEERTLYQWKPRTEDALPEHTVPGGTDEGGSALYIARFNIENKHIFGKAGTQKGVGYYYKDGTQDSKTYEVLTFNPELPAKLVWKKYSPFSWDDMKFNAIGSSEQGYIARAPVLDGEWPTPGNMVEPGRLCLAYQIKGVDTTNGIEVLIVERETPLESHLFDIKYQENKLIKSQSPITVASGTVENKQNEVLSSSLVLSYTKSITHTWKNTFKIKGGVKASFSAKIPFFFAAGSATSMEAEYEHGWDRGETESTTVQVTQNLSVKPKEAVVVKIVAAKIVADIPYTAKIKNTYRDGNSEIFFTEGKYTGVEMTDFRITVDKGEKDQKMIL